MASLSLGNIQVFFYTDDYLLGSNGMYGLVLWSDPKVFKALIWCEDQGDLAYFDGAGESQAAEQEAGAFVPEVGDVLLFDVTDGGTLRRATNLRKLAHKDSADLIANLQEAAKQARAVEHLPQNPIGEIQASTVVQLPTRPRFVGGASGEISSPKKERV